MGWKGTVRSIVAASRAAQREAERQQKIALKERMAADSAAAVADWEDYIEALTSVHTDLSDSVNWHAIADRRPPDPPVLRDTYTAKAQAALASFKPGLIDLFRGGAKKRRHRLEQELRDAPKIDQADYDDDVRHYEIEFKEWDEDTTLARQIVSGEAEAIKKIIEEMASLSDQRLIGSAVKFSIGNGFLHAKPEVHTDDIIPKERRKLLASGRLSESKMPSSQFHELYQDYVASVALKVAGDLFQILPLDEIFVTCSTRMLNTATGHQELTPILSVHFVRDTFSRLKLDGIDPSDAMSNFRHVMAFKKTKGFEAITPLAAID